MDCSSDVGGTASGVWAGGSKTWGLGWEPCHVRAGCPPAQPTYPPRALRKGALLQVRMRQQNIRWIFCLFLRDTKFQD